MLRPSRCPWAVCLILAGPALGQEIDPARPAIVTTLQRPADDAPAVTPLAVPGQTIPPTAVLTSPPNLPPQSAAEEGLTRQLAIAVLAASHDEVGLLFPAVYQNLKAIVVVGNQYATMAQLPSAPLHFTAAPTFDLRVRLSDVGELGVNYRLLASSGDGSVIGLDPARPAAFRSRLDMQTLEINYYATRDVGVWWGLRSTLDNSNWNPPHWSVMWDLGARLASVYFDSRAFTANIDRRFSNSFFGAGPHLGLTLTRTIGDSNLALYGRLDVGEVLGTIRQQFSELSSPGGVPVAFGYTPQSQTQGVPIVATQLGLSWGKPDCGAGQLQLGYQYEQWYLIGDIGASTGSVVLQGLFARWTLNY